RLGRGWLRQAPAPPLPGATPRRLRLGGLRAGGRARRRELDPRGRLSRLRGRRLGRADQALPPRGAARAAREVLLRPQLTAPSFAGVRARPRRPPPPAPPPPPPPPPARRPPAPRWAAGV